MNPYLAKNIIIKILKYHFNIYFLKVSTRYYELTINQIAYYVFCCDFCIDFFE